MNTLGKLFLKGLAVLIPAVLTLAILWWMASSAERLLGRLLSGFLPEGWYIPGMGLLAAGRNRRAAAVLWLSGLPLAASLVLVSAPRYWPAA